MAYVSLVNLKKKIVKNEDFSLTAECDVDQFDEEGGVAINFLEKPPQVPPQEGDEIIFHFNPRPKPPSRIILNTFRKGQWGTEVILEGNSVRTQIFKKMFVLSLKVLSHDGGGSEFLVFLNGSLLTTYRCRLDITKTEYIGFSPALRVVAHKNFKEEAKL